jgi:hypothetical protein
MEQFWESFWEWSKTPFALLGAAGVSSAAVAAAAYGMFKTFGEKWLDRKFATQLEAYKSEQVRELERLRHKISGVFDRTKRLHDREYEVLPEVWAKLVDAKSWAGGYLAAFQQYADIGRMSDADLDEFLASTRFLESQKREIKMASRRQDLYIKTYETYRHYDVIEKLREASVTLSKNGIFVLPALREDMKKLIELIHFAVIEHQINRDHDVRPLMRDAIKKLEEEGEPLFKKIEDSVAARLWDSVTVEV